MKDYGGVNVLSHIFLTSALVGGEIVITSRKNRTKEVSDKEFYEQ
jgi:hypothetical protein